MVGVPRSRGCIGCRQQKKKVYESPPFSFYSTTYSNEQKCIVISKLPCSRCKRLDIPCVGYGERRFKFQDESQTFIHYQNRNVATPSSNSIHSTPALQDEHDIESMATESSTTSSNSPQSTLALQSAHDVQWAAMITPAPISTLSSLIASFTGSIGGHDTDTGHHLAWNFGVFLHDVPRYLGFNEALDAAADALVSGYDHFRQSTSRYTTASAICLRKYSQAVKSLRTCLSTVENACEPTTLCAIQIVMTIEVRENSQMTNPGKRSRE